LGNERKETYIIIGGNREHTQQCCEKGKEIFIKSDYYKKRRLGGKNARLTDICSKTCLHGDEYDENRTGRE